MNQRITNEVVPEINPNCFLAVYGKWEGRGSLPPCDGQLVRCHIISQQILKKHAPAAGLWDPAVWIWGCGGPMGNAGHHGHLDSSRNLRIPYAAIPQVTRIFARKYNLTWWLEREYQRRARPHPSTRSQNPEGS